MRIPKPAKYFMDVRSFKARKLQPMTSDARETEQNITDLGKNNVTTET